MHVWVCTRVCMCVNMHVRVFMCVNMHVHVCFCLCVRMCVFTREYVASSARSAHQATTKLCPTFFLSPRSSRSDLRLERRSCPAGTQERAHEECVRSINVWLPSLFSQATPTHQLDSTRLSH